MQFALRGGFILALDPLEHQAGQVDGVGRRGVVHGLVVGHDFVVKGGGRDRQGMAQQIFTNDDQRQACRPDVFLGTGVSQAHARPIDRARCDVRGAVDHQRRIAAQRFQIRQLVQLDAVDGLVAAHVHVSRVAAELPRSRIGHRGVAIGLVTGNDVHQPVLAGFLLRLDRPGAGHHIVHVAAPR